MAPTKAPGAKFRWYGWAEALDRHPHLSPVAKRAAWQFAARADVRTGECWPSRGYLAAKLATTPRNVTRALTELRRSAALVVLRPETQHAPPLYRLSEDALADVPELSARVDETVQPADRQGGQITSPGGTNHVARVDETVHQNCPRTAQELPSPARTREGGGSGREVGNGSATFGHPSDSPNASGAVSGERSGRTSPDGRDGSLGEGSSDHLAAWVAYELGVGEGVVADALASCPRSDALNVARRLGADVRDGRVKVERSVGGLLRHRLREDPRHHPTPPPPWPPADDTPERRRAWDDERWKARALREEAETRRRLREED